METSGEGEKTRVMRWGQSYGPKVSIQWKKNFGVLEELFVGMIAEPFIGIKVRFTVMGVS